MEKLSENTIQKDWLIASNNAHKIEEIKLFFQWHGMGIRVVGLKEAGIDLEVDETETTFEGNAWLKVNALRGIWNGNILADDSGLCVQALNGAPGIHSARYAGEPTSHANNVSKLLQVMQDKVDRTAHFVTVLVGYYQNQPFEVKGYVHGHITREISGWGGFGYDPIFVPNASSRTFAEMSGEDKNILSHRANALRELVLKIKQGV
ncbi:MAG: putative deoxyribonucleotide triphosphate pyrophosphatase [Bacteroidota bacterium]|jgi:XTP/dITP diphosphohydrolase